ncbi:hypothetical protein M441DRAFT_45169 [Trichoderma asperellum CBS 433.97]|uniref:Uncharacterized protein n=1 Tax=Trichoderma asperellum (strain ATCC 204424 / CBS 433.97 / NBRC 101777) TaxID=1042311 RepID=A0A2T3ZEF2_TRIA4|nr:hypothetical protein M441DRAFT_45169 [Trichoderma asperellum CBS 433.97]PTB43188.1 hypothetical protein M441DRAFT_45169 [Trichoderma asperellum CBS 433.97]
MPPTTTGWKKQEMEKTTPTTILIACYSSKRYSSPVKMHIKRALPPKEMPPARRAVLAAPVLATFGPKAHIPGFSELLRPLLACHLSSTPDSRSEATVRLARRASASTYILSLLSMCSALRRIPAAARARSGIQPIPYHIPAQIVWRSPATFLLCGWR